jgi:hypothetical protein
MLCRELEEERQLCCVRELEEQRQLCCVGSWELEKEKQLCYVGSKKRGDSYVM